MSVLRPAVVSARLALVPALASLVLVWAPGALAASQAQIDAARHRGLAWMLTHQNGNGSWRGPLGTEFAATATSIEALGRAGLRGYPYVVAVSWLTNAPASSVDSLARKILALQPAGVNLNPALQQLLLWRNVRLAWGAYDRYETSFPDTPLALAALRTVGYPYAVGDLTATLCAVVLALVFHPGRVYAAAFGGGERDPADRP